VLWSPKKILSLSPPGATNRLIHRSKAAYDSSEYLADEE